MKGESEGEGENGNGRRRQGLGNLKDWMGGWLIPIFLSRQSVLMVPNGLDEAVDRGERRLNRWSRAPTMPGTPAERCWTLGSWRWYSANEPA